MLYAVGDMDARKRFFHELPPRRSVDAVLVFSLPLSEQESEALRGLDVPLALVGAKSEGFSSVWIDDRLGAGAAVQHLVDLGHRDIGLIHGNIGPARFTPAQDRYTGFVDVLTAQQIALRDELLAEGEFTVSGGERAMNELLTAASPPTAVFAQSDEMAMGALRALRSRGFTVPDDMSVIGFDGHELTGLVDLTTVAQPVSGEGATAAKLLLERLAPDGPTEVDDVVLPTELVVRGSTAAPPGRTDN